METAENLLDQIESTFFSSELELLTNQKITWEQIGELRYYSFKALDEIGEPCSITDGIESLIDELETRAV